MTKTAFIKSKFKINTLYHVISGTLINIFKRVNSFKNMLEYDSWSISNRNNVEENFEVLYLGKDEMDKSFIRNIMFAEKSDEVHLGKVGIFKFFYIWLFEKSFDSIVFQSRIKILNLLKKKNAFIIPAWVGCEIDLNNDIISSGMVKKTLKNNLRTMKRGDFHYVISKDPNDFEFFYYNMYLPYISIRHSDLFFQQSFKEMKKSFDNGELFLIKEGKNIVSGGIIDYKIMLGFPRLTKLGVYNGDFNCVKRGALIALYYYLIQYLKGKSYPKFSLGSVRPFIKDGVLRHKVNWGAKIVLETKYAFLVSKGFKNEIFKKFLINNPFIAINGSKLALSVFSDNSSNEYQSLPKDHDQLYAWGLDEINLYQI